MVHPKNLSKSILFYFNSLIRLKVRILRQTCEIIWGNTFAEEN
jgi:hypothetical protein